MSGHAAQLAAMADRLKQTILNAAHSFSSVMGVNEENDGCSGSLNATLNMPKPTVAELRADDQLTEAIRDFNKLPPTQKRQSSAVNDVLSATIDVHHGKLEEWYGVEIGSLVKGDLKNLLEEMNSMKKQHEELCEGIHSTYSKATQAKMESRKAAKDAHIRI